MNEEHAARVPYESVLEPNKETNMTERKMCGRTVCLLLLCGLISLTVMAQDPIELGEPNVAMTPASNADLASVNAVPSLEDPYGSSRMVRSDRVIYRVLKTERGSTLNVLESDVEKFCGDPDGCSLRLGMYDFDNDGRVASRGALLYYNTDKKVWRATQVIPTTKMATHHESDPDPFGTNANAVIEHMMQAWSCYFTDGLYLNFKKQGDPDLRFGLLSWGPYTAGCFLTIID